MSLAFDTKRADDRKRWLMEKYDSTSSIDRNERNVSVSDFINYELSHFSTYDCSRSIPSVMDGFKPSQRKIMYAALRFAAKNRMKVAQLAPKVAEITDYHHGEVSLMGAIVGMAQDYVGSNNINLLLPLGGFGTRLANGNDAASPRYIFTQVNPIAENLFDTRDNTLLKYLESDGMPIEPEWFAPVLPMILVNGTIGIGTGFSTEVLQYNPTDIAAYISSCLKKRYQRNVLLLITKALRVPLRTFRRDVMPLMVSTHLTMPSGAFISQTFRSDSPRTSTRSFVIVFSRKRTGR